MQHTTPFGVSVIGHLKVDDTTDPKNVTNIVDKSNAVHAQNLGRIFARALSNESNSWIEAIAFGNGGTFINVAQNIQFNTVNDGQPPDARTWDSRLYNETYREIINEGSTSLSSTLGTDPGSADSLTGTRPGGGAVPADDPASVIHASGPGVRSVELGLTSQVIVTCVLNASEPSGQFSTDTTASDGSFMFDEIALFTAGAPGASTSGSHDIDVGGKNANSDTGLTLNTTYEFNIAVDGAPPVLVSFTTPATGGSGLAGQILYGDLVLALRTAPASWNVIVGGSPVTPSSNPLPGGATVNVTNDGTFNGSVPAAETYGFVRFFSGTSGPTSSVTISASASNDLIAALNAPTGGIIKTPKTGSAAGVQNSPSTPTTERERMLTHVIFSPVLKAANRTLTISYTLDIAVARTV